MCSCTDGFWIANLGDAKRIVGNMMGIIQVYRLREYDFEY